MALTAKQLAVFEEILRLVDRPVGTHEEIRNATEDRHINAISEWYDLIAHLWNRL